MRRSVFEIEVVVGGGGVGLGAGMRNSEVESGWSSSSSQLIETNSFCMTDIVDM